MTRREGTATTLLLVRVSIGEKSLVKNRRCTHRRSDK
jgi:hypothetical protein